MNKNNITKMFYRTTKWLEYHSPEILSVIACTGVVVTGILSAKNTPLAIDRIKKAEITKEKEKGEKLTKIETVVNAAPAYIPAITACASTMMCILGANYLSRRKQASLISAYNLLSNYHKQYRKTLIDLKGEEADKEIRTEMARRHCNGHVIGLDYPDDDKIIFIEENSQEQIIAYEREIMDAEYHINRNFTMKGYTTLNEFRHFLGLAPIEGGEDMGWTMADGMFWIDFEHIPLEEKGNNQVFLISTPFGPEVFDESV